MGQTHMRFIEMQQITCLHFLSTFICCLDFLDRKCRLPVQISCLHIIANIWNSHKTSMIYRYNPYIRLKNKKKFQQMAFHRRQTNYLRRYSVDILHITYVDIKQVIFLFIIYGASIVSDISVMLFLSNVACSL